MILSAVLYSLAVGGLLAGAALLLEGALRIAGRPVRWVSAGALAAALLLSALALLAAGAAPGAEASSAAGTSAGPAGGTLVPGWVAGAGGVVRSLVGTPLAAASGWLAPVLGPAWDRVLLLAWAAGALVVLLAFGYAHLRFGYARRAWPRRRVQGVAVRVAPAEGPLVAGLARPEIVVPGWLERATGEEQRAVLAHEQEHIGARDHWVLAFGALALVLLPWHPAAWWLAARLRLAVELDCDARVLRRGVDRAAYGSALLAVAGLRSAFPLAAAWRLPSPSQLERRLAAMTGRTPRYGTARSLGLAALAAGLVLAACEAELPSTPAVERLDAAAAENAAARLGLPGGADYTVDGEPVTAEQARALPPERIRAVAVQRNAGRATIAIETGDAAAARGPVGPQVQVRGAAQGAGEKFAGLLIVDGVVADPDLLQQLSPERIRSIDVVKGDAARQQYADPRAANGVIRITTRAAGN